MQQVHSLCHQINGNNCILQIQINICHEKYIFKHKITFSRKWNDRILSESNGLNYIVSVQPSFVEIELSLALQGTSNECEQGFHLDICAIIFFSFKFRIFIIAISDTAGSHHRSTCSTYRFVIALCMYEHNIWLWYFCCSCFNHIQHMEQSSQVSEHHNFYVFHSFNYFFINIRVR